MNKIYFSYQGWPARLIPRSELPEVVQNWAWKEGAYVEYFDARHWQVTNPAQRGYTTKVKGY